ncbi:MAG TPA: valine--tRNA ligase [Planctomycetes bacterium]|nr:valine--tRNA ligase [Planctomycetota bacterium]
MELSETRYNPQEVEDGWYAFWEGRGLFAPAPAQGRVAYSMVIPPPNVTGVLHMGHALNNTVQDVLVRYHRMRGESTLWVPGTDHAGIATQNVVEKALAEEGKSREELGRDEFVKRVWEWKEKYGGAITRQLRKLGVSCDWSHERFTLDEGLNRAVREAFVRLYEGGLIYRGTYIVNWCPRCLTALADDEVEHEEQDGKLWYIRYPLKGQARRYVTVATTRPETMFGDTAVAVHPEDERHSAYVGKTLILPLAGREIPVITDAAVEPRFGSGAVKITPAHDPNDFEVGRRHKLPQVVVMDEGGRMNENAPGFAGLERFEARGKVLATLEKERLVDREEPHRHAVGRCYRCNTVIEPRLSEQWFVKMKPLARLAMDATEHGKVKFYPKRWAKVYLSWLENVRDWCISRQIWWGHRIPVWRCRDCENEIVAVGDPEKCPRCGSSDIQQDSDVLDTWFSSSLWPFSTLGWPEETHDLKTYYPTNTLVTDRGIIYFWVARMVMMGLYVMKREPFHDVYINGTVLDDTGRKMSKSLGNGIDPLEMIGEYGADAVRTSLILLTVEGQDVKLAPTRLEMGRNFANKVWNAGRFILMKLEDAGSGSFGGGSEGMLIEPSSFGDAGMFERWIISSLGRTARAVGEALSAYRLNEALRAVYDFFWSDFCDWYIEAAKRRGLSEGADAIQKAQAARVLAEVLWASLRLLHPFAPFITEELYSHLRRIVGEERLPWESIMTAPWPMSDAYASDDEAEETMRIFRDVVTGIRNIRQETQVPAREEMEAVLSFERPEAMLMLEPYLDVLSSLAQVKMNAVGVGLPRPEMSAMSVCRGVDVYVILGEYINKERERLNKEIARLTKYLAGIETKLRTPQFLERAPAAVVQAEEERRKKTMDEISRLEKHLKSL